MSIAPAPAPESSPAPSPLRALLVLSGAALGAQLSLSVLGARSLAAEILAAFVVDLVATRFGAAWYGEDIVATRTMWRAAGHGALVVAVAVAGAVAVSLLARFAVIAGATFSALSEVLGAVTALAGAVRRELLYRWIPLRLARRLAPQRSLEATAVLLGASPVALAEPFRPAALAVALATGALSVCLVRRTGGLAASVAAHAVLLFATSTLLTSALDLRWGEGSLTPLENASGRGAWVLAAALLIAAIVVARTREAPPREG